MTSDARGGGRILGSLGSAEGKGIVRMEDRFDADVDEVWSALTDPSRLVRWYGQVEGDLRLGGEYRVRLFASGWEGTGRVEACEPPQRLLVRIKDADEPDAQDIEAMLTADGDQTIVVWEERGMPLDLLSAYGAGVQLHVEDLADHLAGRERRDDTSDGSAAWATVLSPDASRAFVDREHLALLPHRDLLDRPSNRGIRTTPREEPMTTSIRKGSSLCPENGRAPNPTSHQDSGHRYGAFMECHEEGPPGRRHSPVTNPIGKEARGEVCRTRLGVSDGAVVRTRPRRRDRRRGAVRG